MNSVSTLKTQDQSLGSIFGGIKIPIRRSGMVWYEEESWLTESQRPWGGPKVESKGSAAERRLTVLSSL